MMHQAQLHALTRILGHIKIGNALTGCEAMLSLIELVDPKVAATPIDKHMSLYTYVCLKNLFALCTYTSGGSPPSGDFAPNDRLSTTGVHLVCVLCDGLIYDLFH